jgi:uncharacterized lipoprotein YddW (UPF0748 family)
MLGRAKFLLAAIGLALLAACQDVQQPFSPDGGAALRIEGLTLTLSDGAARLFVGDTLRLGVAAANPAARGTPDLGRVSWASSDDAVATVDADGLVHALAPGQALVTATHANGRWADTLRLTVTYPEEARALWVNRFEFSTAASIATIMERAAAANFNIVYFQARGQGDAYYRSELEPCAVGLCGSLGNGMPSWDPLEVAVREARKHGLEIHAWVNAFTGWASPTTNTANYCALLRESRNGAPNHMLIDHPEWQMVSSAGVQFTCLNSTAYEYAYVSPGIPAVRTHLARVAADIARRYDVDGIHLDRVRYPSPYLSYDAPSLAAFGRRPTAFNEPAWNQWRRDAVGAAVRELADSVRAAKPRAVISAAVWGIYQDRWGWNSSHGYDQYLQDPRAWAAGGYLDVAVPMTYYNTHNTYCGFADWACVLDDHLAGYADTGRDMYIAISPAQPASKTNDHVVGQIELGRQKGAKGFAFYSYNAMNSRNLWPVLAEGPFREPAAVPHMSWK